MRVVGSNILSILFLTAIGRTFSFDPPVGDPALDGFEVSHRWNEPGQSHRDPLVERMLPVVQVGKREALY
jgi:hypothetical protein